MRIWQYKRTLEEETRFYGELHLMLTSFALPDQKRKKKEKGKNMASYRLRKPLVLIAILSLLLTQCTTTIKFTKADDSTQDGGFVGVYRNFPSTHPDFTGTAEPKNTKGLIYDSLPWRPNPAGPWGGNAVWQPDWYSTPSCLVRIDPAVMNDQAPITGVTGTGLEFTPSDFQSIPELTGGAHALFTVEWEARINMTQTTYLNFTMNSNDDSWFFFNGTLKIDLGGGRNIPMGAGAWMSPVLPAGSVYTITIYYAERNTAGNGTVGGGPAEFYFGATPTNAFVYTNPSNLYAKKSFEDLLRHQAAGIESFEDLLGLLPAANRTAELFESLENLTEEQEGNLESFEGMIENETPQWIVSPLYWQPIVNESRLLPAEFIGLLESFENLLHTQYDIKERFMKMLNESQTYLPNFPTFLNSTENLLTSDDELLQSFENLTRNLFPSSTPQYIPPTAYTTDQQTYFLESYEQLLENQSQLLQKFGKLIPDDPSVTQAQISTAVANGVKWLATQQSTTDGSWPGYFSDSIATTGLAVLKLEEYAYELNYTSPFDPRYEYSKNVTAGLNFLFANLATNKMTLQDHRSGATGTVDNPDVSGDGLGVYANNGYLEGPVYDTGIVLSAISASGTPTMRVSVASSIVNTWTYLSVAQDMVDWLAWAQSDYPSGGSGEGGWTYWACVNATGGDNSNSGYATMGLAYAEGFGCTIPAWVITELKAWIVHIQDASGTSNDGGSWYVWNGDGVGVNILKTGNLILEMKLVGDLPTDPKVVKALNYLKTHWTDPSGDEQPPGWDGNPAAYQAMFTTMKGLEYMGISTLPGGIDWYNDFADRIVAQQITTPGPEFGSWQQSADEGNGSATIITAWALLTLEKVAPAPAPSFKESFEDLLRRQSERIESFESLLGLLPKQNRTAELFESLENLTEEQEGLVNGFEGMINATSLPQPRFIRLLNSTEDLLDRQYVIKENFMNILNQSKPFLGANFTELTSSMEELLRSDAQLLSGFEGLVSNLFSLSGVTLNQKIYFLESYEQLLEDQSQLLEKFEELDGPPIIPPQTVTITPASVTMDVGQSQLFTSSVSGGAPPYSYQWYLNGAPVAGATSADWLFAPSSLGNYTVCLWVTCSVGASSSSISITTANPQLVASIIPNDAIIYLGQSQTFTSTISGGTPLIAYQWYLNGVAVPGATGSTWTFSPSSTGIYTVNVKATDSLGEEAISNDAIVQYIAVATGSTGGGGHFYLR
jgi:fibro-slime domain-containing protein